MANKLKFEQGMQELEALARALETGEMSLEDSFKAFEKANKLRVQLQQLLDEGDKKIRLLTDSDETELNPEVAE